jgi:hypothetical protein
MKRLPGRRTRWLLVVAFAVAMAWVEAACVFYLRSLVGRLDPYQLNPLPMGGVLGQVELVREAATMVMLLAVGVLAGRRWRAKTGYSLIAFGIWDIFYYGFLRLIYGWPRSPFDWDVLFLIPLPWWGPVLAPVCIALLMIAWGTLVTQSAREATFTSWGLNAAGAALALYVFMTDALRAVPQGMDAARSVLPTQFNWPLFLVALALMGAPVAEIAWRACNPRLFSPDERVVERGHLCEDTAGSGQRRH